MEPVEEVLLNHRTILLAFIQKRIYDPDLAEDILQEGLLKALRSAGDLRDEDRLIPWFFQILNHAIIDTYRNKCLLLSTRFSLWFLAVHSIMIRR